MKAARKITKACVAVGRNAKLMTTNKEAKKSRKLVMELKGLKKNIQL